MAKLRDLKAGELHELIETGKLPTQGGLPGISGFITRWLAKNLSASPKEAKDFLERQGFTVQQATDKGKLQFLRLRDGTLKGEADYAKSMGNRMLFHPNTLTVAFFGSSSPQSAGVFAGFHTELVEALQAGCLAQGYHRFRNMDYSWGLKHYIFRGVDGKILNGDPFVRYTDSGKEVYGE